MVLLPIECIRTQRRGAQGRYRFYAVYQLPPEYGGGELPVRLCKNEADRTRGLNRAEHLRAIPPTDPDFPRLKARRNDAESINRALEDTLYWGRAHSVGRVAQEADLLGFGLSMNALSWHRHRKRKEASAAA